jgi:hypothetical protein
MFRRFATPEIQQLFTVCTAHVVTHGALSAKPPIIAMIHATLSAIETTAINRD